MADATENQFLGALLGMAIGDALGAPVSGLSRAEIAARHGDVSGYLDIPAGGEEQARPGAFTDETEFTLCLVESMTANRGRIDPETAGVRLLHLASGPSRHWIHPDTLRALETANETLDFVAPLHEDGPATGDVAARGVAIGLMHAVGRFSPDALRSDAETASRLTHGGPAAFNAVTAVAFAVRLAATGAPRETWASSTAEFLGGGSLAEQLATIEPALAAQGVAATLDAIGTGIEATQSVPAAITLAMAFPQFEEALFAAANAGGASDTIGAITGAIAGAANGASDIPQDLIDGLEGRIYVSLAAPWLYKAARQRAGQLIDLRPVHGPRLDLPPRR